MEILIIQTAYIGDLLLGIPLIKQVRVSFPESRITVLCRHGLGSFLRELRLADEAVEYNKNEPGGWAAVKTALKNQRFDHVICPHQSIRSALLVRQLDSAEKTGFREWWNGIIFTRRLPRPMHLPEALRQLSLLTLIDKTFARTFQDFVSDPKVYNTKEQGPIRHWDHSGIPNWASLSLKDALPEVQRPLSGQPIVFMAPGSVWPTKRWTPEGFIELGQRLREDGFGIILIGSREERPLCQTIADRIPDAVNLAGESTLVESMSLLKQGELLITNDSGAMHMGTVAGIRVISLFGPTVLELGYRPWSETSSVVQTPLACRPCGRHGSRRCPLGTHECMKSISAATVHEMVKNALAEI